MRFVPSLRLEAPNYRWQRWFPVAVWLTEVKFHTLVGGETQYVGGKMTAAAIWLSRSSDGPGSAHRGV